MSLPSYLEVPVVYQEDDFSCVPACIKMVLEFVRTQNPGAYVPNVETREIGETIGTDELGTSLDDVKKINDKLLKTVPSVEFVTEMNCSFFEIEKEILQGKPVIAWIKIPYSHSVVVTGLDTTLLIVYYNDPQRGKRQMEMGKFISCWGEVDNTLIKVKVGEKLQRIMPEYVPKTEQRDGER
ncbi:MAG: C39 family peptidase [Candidatus Bathyarchaeia archaeon]